MSFLPQKFTASFMDIILGTLGSFFLLLIIVSTNHRGIHEEGSQMPLGLLTVSITDNEFNNLHFGENIGYFVGLIDDNKILTEAYYSDYDLNSKKNDADLKITKMGENNASSLFFKINVSEENRDKLVVGFWLKELSPGFNPSIINKMFQEGIPIKCSVMFDKKNRLNETFSLKKDNLLFDNSKICSVPFFCVINVGKGNGTKDEYAVFIKQKQQNYQYQHKSINNSSKEKILYTETEKIKGNRITWKIKYYAESLKASRIDDVSELFYFNPYKAAESQCNIQFAEKINNLIRPEELRNNKKAPDYSPEFVIRSYLTEKEISANLKYAYLGTRAFVLVMEDNTIIYRIMSYDHPVYRYRSWKKIYPSPNDGAEAKWETISASDINKLKGLYPELGENFIYAFAECLAEPLPDQGTAFEPLPFRRNPMLDLWINNSVPK